MIDDNEYEKYEQEGLFLRRLMLYKQHQVKSGENIDFNVYLQFYFPRDDQLQERIRERHGECERGVCKMFRERNTQTFWTLEEPPRNLRTTGDVYVCVISGALHVCTSELCRTRFIPRDSFATVCKLTSKVHDDDMLMLSEGKQLGEYHVQACSSGIGYQPDNGNPNFQGTRYDVFDSKSVYKRNVKLADKRLAHYSDRIVKAGYYSENAQELNDRFEKEANGICSKVELEALCIKYEAKATMHGESVRDFSFYTEKIGDSAKSEKDAEIAIAKFLERVAKSKLTLQEEHKEKLEELCAKYAQLANIRSGWRDHGTAVYRNEVLGSMVAQEQLRRGEIVMEEFRKSCRDHTLKQAEKGLAIDMRVLHDLYLEHNCGIHVRIKQRLANLEKIDKYKTEAEEDVVSLVVDIWSALYDLKATRNKNLEFRDCVLAILGYMSGSYANFVESLSGGKYGTDSNEMEVGLQQMVKVDLMTGLAYNVKNKEVPERDRFELRVVTFVPCVPGLRIGPISSGSIAYDARKPMKGGKLSVENNNSLAPSSSSVAKVNERHLDTIVANMKPSEKKKKARKDTIPGFSPSLNSMCTEDSCVDLILAASKRAGVNAKNIKNVEQRHTAKTTLKCRQLASGARRMTSKKNLHRIITSLLDGSLPWTKLERFNFAVSERLLQLHEKYRLYEVNCDEK